MKISLKVHPKSSIEKIKKLSEKEYEIWIKSAPEDGKANREVEKTLSKYFGKPAKVVLGKRSRKKIIEIEE